MPKKAILLTLLMMSLPLCGTAAPPPTSLPPKVNTPTPQPPVPLSPESTEESKTTDKKTWLVNVQNMLPVALCDKNNYFVKCFETTHEQCVEFTKMLVEACANNAALALPQEMDKRQGEYWGQMIGRCSYDLYEKFMKPKKRALPECHPVEKKDDLPKPSQTIP